MTAALVITFVGFVLWAFSTFRAGAGLTLFLGGLLIAGINPLILPEQEVQRRHVLLRVVHPRDHMLVEPSFAPEQFWI